MIILLKNVVFGFGILYHNWKCSHSLQSLLWNCLKVMKAIRDICLELIMGDKPYQIMLSFVEKMAGWWWK